MNDCIESLFFHDLQHKMLVAGLHADQRVGCQLVAATAAGQTCEFFRPGRSDTAVLHAEADCLLCPCEQLRQLALGAMCCLGAA
jgi:hypothetical protein